MIFVRRLRPARGTGGPAGTGQGEHRGQDELKDGHVPYGSRQLDPVWMEMVTINGEAAAPIT